MDKICYFGGSGSWRQRGWPGKTWKDIVDKDVNDLHTKQTDAVDHSKWREMIRGSNRGIDSDVMPRAECELYVYVAG